MVDIGSDVSIGDGKVVIMAGPCSVEGYDQIRNTGAALKENGLCILRGGAFKPRTSPHTFQGLGLDGLKMLRAVANEFGLYVITEALSVENIRDVSEYSDIVQIGSRNMQHYPILWAAGEQDKPILLKRGFMNTLDEFLLAAEHISSRGNSKIILCERGIRTFDNTTRFTLDISAIPLLKQRSGLPVVADPSHAAGRADLVTSLSLASIAAGADGILVEFHPNPQNALSDGNQSLPLDTLPKFISQMRSVAFALGRNIH